MPQLFDFGRLRRVPKKKESDFISRNNKSAKAGFAVVLMTLAALCFTALAQENTAESWYQKGQELEKMGSWQAAVDAYDQAVKLNPEYKEAWCAKCKALSNVNLELSGEGQNITFTDAIHACDKALQIDPKNARSWSGKGFVLYQEAFVIADPSKYNDSLQAYQKAIEVAGADKSALAEAWRGKGTVLSQMGRNKEALAAQEKAIELNRSDVEAWMGKAVALSKMDRNEEAVQAYNRIIELYPNEDQRIFDYPYLWHSKGRALEKLGRDEEAAHAYNKSIEDVDTIIGWIASGRDFYMNLSEAWQYKGDLLKEQGRYEEAARAQELVADSWYKKGQEQEESGSWDEAVKAYDLALHAANETLKKKPQDATAWQTKGQVLERLHRTKEAVEAFDKVVELNPKNAGAWLHKGKALDMSAYGLQGQERNKTFEDAVKSFDKAIEINPNYGEAWMNMGYSLDGLATFGKNLGKYNESLEAFDKALGLIPANDTRNLALAYEGKALALHHMGNSLSDMAKDRYEKAIQSYDKALELDPDFTGLEAQLNKAGALEELGKYKESLAALDKVIETMPTNNTQYLSMVWADKGDVLEKMRNYDKSHQAFNQSLDLNPANAVAWQGKGDVLLALGRNSEADAAYAKARELGYSDSAPTQENTTEAWFNKGQELFRNGANEEAVEAYDKVIELNQSYAEAWRAKGQAQVLLAMESRGDIRIKTLDEAVRSYEKAIEIEPQNTTLWNYKGLALSTGALFSSNPGDLRNQSLQAYDKALELDPKNAESWRGKGVVYAEQKEYDLALEAFNKSLEADPKYGWALTSKGSALMQMGRLDEAVEAFDAALKISPDDPGARMMKAEALARLGQQNESEQAYAEALHRAEKAIEAADSPENLSRAWHDKATVLIDQGSYAEAIEAYENVTEANPRDRSAWLMMAFAADQTARYDKALEAYEGVLALNGNDSYSALRKR